VVVSGYGDAGDWRSLSWAMREMGENYMTLGLKRSAEDLFNLWFNRKAYVRKYYPELLDG
jgi:hypothetical protein